MTAQPAPIPNKVKGLPYRAMVTCQGCDTLWEADFPDAYVAEGFVLRGCAKCCPPPRQPLDNRG